MRKIGLMLSLALVLVVVGCAMEREEIIPSKPGKPKIHSLEVPSAITFGQRFPIKFKFSSLNNIEKVIYSWEAIGTRERHITGPFEIKNFKISDVSGSDFLKECEFILLIPTVAGVPWNYEFSVQIVDNTGEKSNKKTNTFAAGF